MRPWINPTLPMLCLALISAAVLLSDAWAAPDLGSQCSARVAAVERLPARL